MHKTEAQARADGMRADGSTLGVTSSQSGDVAVQTGVLPLATATTAFADVWGGLSGIVDFPPPTPTDAPLPAMPGDAPSPANAAPPAASSGAMLTEDMLQPMGLTPTAARTEEDSGGVGAFLRQVVMGGGSEQRPDVGLGSSLRETAKRLGSTVADKGKQGNPGLFAAMDAPLRGLTPDDILFANEVDAALARRPRFGARVLSVCVALMFVSLVVWAAFASVDEVTHAEG